MRPTGRGDNAPRLMTRPLLFGRLELGITLGYTFGMKIAVSIPDELFERAEAEAKRLGVSRSKLYQAAIEKHLTALKSSEINAALRLSYSQSPEPVDPFIQSLAEQAMRRTEWADETGRDLVGKHRRAARVRTRVPAARRDRVGK